MVGPKVAQRFQKAKKVLRVLALVGLVLFMGFLAGTGAATLAFNAGIGAPQIEDPSPGAQAAPSSDAADGSASETLTAQQGQTPTPWDPLESPNYYRVTGQAVVSYDVASGQSCYAPLDALGRARGAATRATYDSMMAGRNRARENLSEVTPSGWGHNQEVDIAMPDGTIYHGQLFNRSHLVAKSLGGDDAAHNLICATRTQNVGANVNGTEGGMAYGEGLVRAWLESHHEGEGYYAATPVYEGNELLARSVYVDILTSDGSINQRIEVYNAAYGFDLDYQTGTFTITEDAAHAATSIRGMLGDAQDGAADTQETELPEQPDSTSMPEQSASNEAPDHVTPAGTPTAEDGERKVIVTGSGQAYHHDETCSGLEHARSLEWVTVAEAESMGRHPCGICGG